MMGLHELSEEDIRALFTSYKTDDKDFLEWSDLKEAAAREEPKKKGFKKDGSARKVPAISGYRVFSKAKREEAVLALKEENDAKKLTVNGNVKQGAVVAKLGEWWKALDEAEQQVWKDDAKEQESERLALQEVPKVARPASVSEEGSDEEDLDLEENSSDDED